ncbi:Chaperone modulatory protein CbpM [compost metagenome]
MKTETLILVKQFCVSHDIDITFITALQNFGLIEIIVVEENQYLDPQQLKEVEKMIRLHYDLEVNLEGIDIITNLLKRIEYLQTELVTAQNKLKLLDVIFTE